MITVIIPPAHTSATDSTLVEQPPIEVDGNVKRVVDGALYIYNKRFLRKETLVAVFPKDHWVSTV